MAENATLSFYTNCLSLSSSTDMVYSPITGIISRITISWPSGCNFLVEVLFRCKKIQFVPTPSTGGELGIRLNNYTEQINPYYPVSNNDLIEMYVENHDAVNNHAIAAVVHIDSLSTSESEEMHPRRRQETCVVQQSFGEEL